jgi:hypothetical protein
MPFEKGKSGNPKGRKKGSENKVTTEFKEHLNKLLEDSAPKLIEWLAEIEDPYKRFEILSKFSEYVHPKLARTELTGKDGDDLEFTIKKVVHSARDRD